MNLDGALVVDQNSELLCAMSWQQAIIRWFPRPDRFSIVLEHERVILVETRDWLGARCIGPYRIKRPAVLQVVDRMGSRNQVAPTVRNLMIRDNGQCQYCGTGLFRCQATLDHILPRSRNGGSTWQNLVIACSSCNNRKADRTPVEAGMSLITSPWVPTFEDLVLILGRRGVLSEAWSRFLKSQNKI